MSRDTVVTYKGKEYRFSGVVGSYLQLCGLGFGGGLMVGMYVGGAVGVTAAALSPAIIGYSLFKVGRTLLRR